MTEPLTPAELDKLEKRLKAATIEEIIFDHIKCLVQHEGGATHKTFTGIREAAEEIVSHYMEDRP